MATLAEVEATLHRLYLAAGTQLRREDLKKARAVEALLGELGRVAGSGLLVDGAAGNGYVGILAAELLGFRRVLLLERSASGVERSQSIARAMSDKAEIEVRAGDVGDPALWRAEVEVVVALHACGRASDQILDRAVGAHARWIFVVPCCYGADVPFDGPARALADRLGVARQAAVRTAFVRSIIDSERTLRLESAGYEVTALAFVPASVTEHNLLLRARRVGEPKRMAEAAAKLAQLHQG
jgi:hypothetical protein